MKKFLIASLTANMFLLAFVLYAFLPQAKKADDGAGSYLFLNVTFGKDMMLIDGNTTTKTQLAPLIFSGSSGLAKNYETIAAKLDDLKKQGYELVSSNSDTYLTMTTYVLEKK